MNDRAGEAARRLVTSRTLPVGALYSTIGAAREGRNNTVLIQPSALLTMRNMSANSGAGGGADGASGAAKRARGGGGEGAGGGGEAAASLPTQDAYFGADRTFSALFNKMNMKQRERVEMQEVQMVGDAASESAPGHGVIIIRGNSESLLTSVVYENDDFVLLMGGSRIRTPWRMVHESSIPAMQASRRATVTVTSSWRVIARH